MVPWWSCRVLKIRSISATVNGAFMQHATTYRFFFSLSLFLSSILLPVHISNEFAQSVFPLDIRLRLYSLIGIAHHSDQEINKHHHRHQHVNTEGKLEENGRPRGLHIFYLELFVCRLTEDGEEQELDREYGIHPDCKYVLNNVSRKVSQKFSATVHTHANVATTKRRKKNRFQAIQSIYAATHTNSFLPVVRKSPSA